MAMPIHMRIWGVHVVANWVPSGVAGRFQSKRPPALATGSARVSPDKDPFQPMFQPSFNSSQHPLVHELIEVVRVVRDWASGTTTDASGC